MSKCKCTHCDKDLSAVPGDQNISYKPSRYKVSYTPFSSAHVHLVTNNSAIFFCSKDCIVNFYSE